MLDLRVDLTDLITSSKLVFSFMLNTNIWLQNISIFSLEYVLAIFLLFICLWSLLCCHMTFKIQSKLKKKQKKPEKNVSLSLTYALFRSVDPNPQSLRPIYVFLDSTLKRFFPLSFNVDCEKVPLPLQIELFVLHCP